MALVILPSEGPENSFFQFLQTKTGRLSVFKTMTSLKKLVIMQDMKSKLMTNAQ